MALKRFLLGILLLGGLLAFYEFVLVAPPPPKEEQNAPGVDNSPGENRERDIVDKENNNSPSGIIDSFLQGIGVTQKTGPPPTYNTTSPAPPLASAEDNDTPPGIPGEEATSTEEAIKSYLIASSEIEFFNNPVEIQIALQLAEGGNFSKLVAIIEDFEKRLEAFRQLSPPEPAADIHRKSLEITEGFIELLRDVRNKKHGTIEAAWNSPERAIIVAKTQEIVKQIQELIAVYNIELPPNILPTQPQ